MKGFASDFDGTLYFSNEVPSIRIKDRDAIQAYQKQGYLFGICTGRPLSAVLYPVGSLIQFDFYIVCSGALILDRNQKVLFERSVSRDVAFTVYDFVKESCDVSFLMRDGLYCMGQKIPECLIQTCISNLNDLPNDSIYALSLRYETKDLARESCDRVQKKFGNFISVFQNGRYLDLVSRGCSKGKGIQIIKEAYSLEVVAGAGDSLNDLPMFEAVDVSYGMRHGDLSVDSCDHWIDSLYEALEKSI